MKRVIFQVFSFFILFIGTFGQAIAQCPMCKAGVENQSELESSTSHLAEGLNVGILYLFVLPYLLILTIGLLWYRSYRQKKAREITEAAHS